MLNIAWRLCLANGSGAALGRPRWLPRKGGIFEGAVGGVLPVLCSLLPSPVTKSHRETRDILPSLSGSESVVRRGGSISTSFLERTRIHGHDHDEAGDYQRHGHGCDEEDAAPAGGEFAADDPVLCAFVSYSIFLCA